MTYEGELTKVLIGTVCSLSLIGSMLIIVTYVLFKDLRANATLLLFHLSIMDLGTALANMAGTVVDFDDYYTRHPSNHSSSMISDNYTVLGRAGSTVHHPSDIIKAVCISQAALATYFDLGSLLWTLSMACFLYLKIVYFDNEKFEGRVLYFTGLLCYLLPLLFVCWAYYLGRLGYSHRTTDAALGWCGYKTIDHKTGENYPLMSVLGYGIWIALLFILVPILCIGILLHMGLMVR